MNGTTKPGYKTTEFWLSLLAVLMGAVVASGVIPPQGPWSQVFGLLTSLLTAAGYTASRGFTKSTELKSSAIVEAHTVQANAAVNPRMPAAP